MSVRKSMRNRYSQYSSSIYRSSVNWHVFFSFFPSQSCPKVVHDLMLSCWSKDRSKRPKFTMIQETLEKWIGNPHLLLEIASVVTKGLVKIISCESLFFIVMFQFLFFIKELFFFYLFNIFVTFKRYFSAFFLLSFFPQ